MRFNSLLLIPSVYGLTTWLFALAAAEVQLVDLNPLSSDIYLATGILLCSTLLSIATLQEQAVSTFNERTRIPRSSIDSIVLTVSGVLGLVGILLYIRDAIGFYGSMADLAFVLINATLDLRRDASEIQSIGFQLSYFGWIYIPLSILRVRSGRNFGLLNTILLSVMVFMILGNLLFIDRTRPVWILVTTVLTLIFSSNTSQKSMVFSLLSVFVAPIIIFMIFSVASGKYNEEYGVVTTAIAYIVSGVAYLDSQMKDTANFQFIPIRSIYPIAKVLEAIGILDDVPSQVLEDREVPFLTNVGTFMEPLFSDGGWLYLFLLVPLITIGLDRIALWFFRLRTASGVFVWSNLVFTSLIGFFVPKFNSTNIYLFGALVLVVTFLISLNRRSS